MHHSRWVLDSLREVAHATLAIAEQRVGFHGDVVAAGDLLRLDAEHLDFDLGASQDVDDGDGFGLFESVRIVSRTSLLRSAENRSRKLTTPSRRCPSSSA